MSVTLWDVSGKPAIAARVGSTGVTVGGDVWVVCEECGSPRIDYCGHDIDKCQDCGHWRYR